MELKYEQSGNYIAIASVIVLLASHSPFNLVVTQNDVLTIIAGIGAVYGIVKQFIAHRKLAVGASQFGSVQNLK